MKTYKANHRFCLLLQIKLYRNTALLVPIIGAHICAIKQSCYDNDCPAHKALSIYCLALCRTSLHWTMDPQCFCATEFLWSSDSSWKSPKWGLAGGWRITPDEPWEYVNNVPPVIHVKQAFQEK